METNSEYENLRAKVTTHGEIDSKLVGLVGWYSNFLATVFFFSEQPFKRSQCCYECWRKKGTTRT